MLFFGLIENRAQSATFGIGFGKTRFDLAELRPCCGQGVFAFGQPPGQPGGLVQRLIDRNLQRALLVFEQGQFFARSGEFALETDYALLRDIELVLQCPTGFGNRPALRGFVRQLTVEFVDLRVTGIQVVG
jgi:hypothetical protein